jgi:hypothetical protein
MELEWWPTWAFGTKRIGSITCSGASLCPEADVPSTFKSVCPAAAQTSGVLPLHPRHRHDLDDFYPCAWHLQMRMVFAEYLRGRIRRFGLHNRIASNLIFCI